VGGVVTVAAVAFGIVLAYVAHNAEPILRRRVIANLQERFQSPVELDALHISVAKGLQVSGSGLRILSFGQRPGTAQAEQAPMLAVKSFSFRMGVRQLLQPTMHVAVVRVEGMQLTIPPKQERAPLVPRKNEEEKRPKRSIVVDRIECSDVTLTIATNKPGKLPLVFDISHVTLHDVGAGRSMPFEAQLMNAKPVGDIASTGKFGPWQSDDPRETPVEGSYSFTKADLGTIKGISGTLDSTGRYSGVLGEIGVTGTTETPDFALDMSEHPVNLRTEFDATVDGTTGDTILNAIHATLRNTVLEVKGKVIRASDLPGVGMDDVQGHQIEIAVVSDKARIEDVLTLGAKTSPPLMNGALTLRAQLMIPPGKVSVTKKMKIAGTFNIREATFSNPQWQQTVDKLSARASGNPEKANAQDAARVASGMGGNFALADAVVNISKLHYQMPGAAVDLTGNYSLDGERFDFSGTVRTDATASQMLTGWKSIVAMPFDKLLKKDGAGVQAPITISGTKSAPKLGLDLGKLSTQILSRHKDEKPAPAPDTNQAAAALVRSRNASLRLLLSRLGARWPSIHMQPQSCPRRSWICLQSIRTRTTL